MKIPKWGLSFLYLLYLKSYFKKQKSTTFVRLSDYYLNIPLWGHSFLISFYLTCPQSVVSHAQAQVHL
jgi:hypothetical protein